MTLALPLGRITGVKVLLHFTFWILVIYSFLNARISDWWSALFVVLWLLMVIASVIIHEAGHLLVAKLCRISPGATLLWPLGGVALGHPPSRRPFAELLVALAGPLMNVIIALLAGAILIWSGFDLQLWQQQPTTSSYDTLLVSLLQVNVWMVIFNLIPAFPLDGGKIVHILLGGIIGRRRSSLVVLVLSWLIGIALGIYGYLIQNPFPVIIALMVFLSAGQLDDEVGEIGKRAPQFFGDRGSYHLDRGQHEQAIQHYDEQIAKQPSALLYYNRGLSHYMAGNYDAAIVDFTALLDIQPSDVEGYIQRGMSYFAKGEIALAARDYDRALHLNPTNPVAHNNYGYIAELQGETHDALTHYTQAVQFSQDFVRAYINRAKLYDKLNQPQRALTDYTRAIDRQPANADLYLRRGLVYKQQGMRAQALDDLNKVVELAPDSELAQEASLALNDLLYSAPALTRSLSELSQDSAVE